MQGVKWHFSLAMDPVLDEINRACQKIMDAMRWNQGTGLLPGQTEERVIFAKPTVGDIARDVALDQLRASVPAEAPRYHMVATIVGVFIDAVMGANIASLFQVETNGDTVTFIMLTDRKVT